MATAVYVPRVNNNDDEVKLIELKAAVGQAVAGPVTSRWMGIWGMRRVLTVTLLICAAAISGIAAFVFAMIALFRKTPSPTMVLLYAVCQGFALGAISLVYETFYNGIILQAVIGTFAVVGVTLALFASGKIRASARATVARAGAITTGSKNSPSAVPDPSFASFSASIRASIERARDSSASLGR